MIRRRETLSPEVIEIIRLIGNGEASFSSTSGIVNIYLVSGNAIRYLTAAPGYGKVLYEEWMTEAEQAAVCRAVAEHLAAAERAEIAKRKSAWGQFLFGS